jgi:hypothetical protein
MSAQLEQLQMQPQRLARLVLPYEPLLIHGRAVVRQAETLDVRVRRDASFARGRGGGGLCYYWRGHFVDLDDIKMKGRNVEEEVQYGHLESGIYGGNNFDNLSEKMRAGGGRSDF